MRKYRLTQRTVASSIAHILTSIMGDQIACQWMLVRGENWVNRNKTTGGAQTGLGQAQQGQSLSIVKVMQHADSQDDVKGL
ncbi:MAG: hypothetical protein A2X72_04800 [Burkholderiales bacterium GWF1_66_17]|nr:MAG: hypothetical protein A2X73_19895 [Burkholderiales bacterium GWE1_65_30]OGA91483.1 MAG: hypothetical protein A2X72_04800 [Burkholderiales bacterium GWF1_66_17]